MYAIEEEQQQSWNYNLGHRWKFDNPEQAGIGLIETVIPFIETEVVKD